MARGVPGFVRIGAALAGCALVAACTPEAGPTQTPTPSAEPPSSTSAPSASVSPTPSATPTETEIERRQRLDFEAAEKAYRANVSEQDRQTQLGIAQESAVLKQTSHGEYLKFTLKSLRTIQGRGWRAVGVADIAGVSLGGWKRNQLKIIACEDGSKIRFTNNQGKDVTPKNLQRRFIQTYTVVAIEKQWKLTDLSSRRVATFEGAACDR